MKYLGNKKYIRNNILEIIDVAKTILGTDNYYEPFVGGCNIIPHVDIKHRYGSDYNTGLVEFIKHIREHGVENLPEFVSEEEHELVRNHKKKVPIWLYFYIINFGTFLGSGRGYGVIDTFTGNNKLIAAKKSLSRELELLNNFDIKFSSYDELDIKTNSIIYCDPPYKNVAGYKGTGYIFDNAKFEKWAIEKSRDNFVIVSEYFMRKPFINIEWIEMNKGILGGNLATEGIFLVKGGLGVKEYREMTKTIEFNQI